MMGSSFNLEKKQWFLLLGTFAVVLIGLGFYSVRLGRDTNFDLKMYHWYNGYAYWENRYEIDMQPSEDGFWTNSYLDAAYYKLASNISPKTLAFVLGSMHGITVVLLGLLSIKVLPFDESWKRVCLGLLTALVGAFNAISIGILGTTFYDSLLFCLPLAAILLLVVALERDRPIGSSAGEVLWVILAGFLVGIAAGLKLVNGYWTVGIAAAIPFCALDGWRILRSFTAFSLGVLAGMLSASGVWWWWAWQVAGNPIFPLYNRFFGSPLGPDYTDTFRQHSLWEFLTYPFRLAFHYNVGGSVPVLDLRLCVVLLLIGAVLIVQVYRLARRTKPGQGRRLERPARLVLAVFVFSYVTWLLIFGNFRYAVGLLTLAPLVIVLLVEMLPLGARAHMVLVVGIFAVVTVVIRPQDYGRSRFDGEPPHVLVPSPDQFMGSMILMTGTEPTAFVVPSFPHSIPFVRIESNWLDPGRPELLYNKMIAKRIQQHRGELFVVFKPYNKRRMLRALGIYNLVPDLKQCVQLYSNIDNGIPLCPVRSAAEMDALCPGKVINGVAPIDFGRGGNSGQYTREGWSGNENDGRWSDGDLAIVESGPYGGDMRGVELVVMMDTRSFDGGEKGQRVRVSANGKDLGEVRIGRDLVKQVFKIPAGTVRTGGKLTLKFQLPDAHSPYSLGNSKDARRLGLWVETMEILQCDIGQKGQGR